MKILGIDPGSRKLGLALINASHRGPECLYSDTLYFQRDDFINRLPKIYQALYEVADKYRPDTMAIESLVHVKNVVSLAKLAQARGAAVAGILQVNEIAVHEYSPNFVKSTVTGFGHVNKDGIQKMITSLIGKNSFKSDDESDAIAIALCHYFSIKGRVRSNKSDLWS